MNSTHTVRANVRVNGIVQGVGFRPFIHRQIQRYDLTGWIRNNSRGVELELEGPRAAVEQFIAEIPEKCPALAMVESVEYEWLPSPAGYTDFRILPSRDLGKRQTLIAPDTCTCPDCLKELFQPGNRRYGYPFINCTNCGPRFTIIRDIPYDRPGTTMAAFPMCDDCVAEYGDITDRRYHAQPNCCPECGPQVSFLDGEGRIAAEGTPDNHRERPQGTSQEPKETGCDPIALAADRLRAGDILAIKGLGGFHLACRCDDEALVRELRRRKQRDARPFAIMCRDVDTARRLCEVSPDEQRILESAPRPIVLLRKRNPGTYRYISENNYIGVMLPYTPLHFLLFARGPAALVMTSANLSDLPIIYRNEEALAYLRGIADGCLLHDRDIETRCDDSLLWVAAGRPYFVRRSRGYVPYPISVRREGLPGNDPAADGHQAIAFGGHPAPHPEGTLAPLPTDPNALSREDILAAGAEQKASFALFHDHHVFLSQHIGDLKNMETLEAYERQIAHFRRMFDIEPKTLVCDLHPDYLSTGYVREQGAREGLRVLQVQHHHAHMASCMADNSLEGDVIGLIWDGTGYGADGTVWGGEFLTGGYTRYERRGAVRAMRLPGGDRATKEIWRMGVMLLEESGVDAGEFFAGGQQEDRNAGTGFPEGQPEDREVRRIHAEHPTGSQLSQVRTMLAADLNCPETSSMGRLFDGAAAILGIAETASYEGQGAVLLEAAGGRFAESGPYGPEEEKSRCISREENNTIGNNAMPEPVFSYTLEKQNGLWRFDYRPMIREMAAALKAGRPREELAAAFMNTLTAMAAEICCRIREDCGLTRVVLSGGTWQNQYLLRRATDALTEQGFAVYCHSRVSPNDEGICLGQGMIASRGGEYYVSCSTPEDR